MTYPSKRPEDILPEDINYVETNTKGVQVRKGTFAAVLHNASILASSSASVEEKEAAQKIITELAHGLAAFGISEHLTWKNPAIQKIMDAAAINH